MIVVGTISYSRCIAGPGSCDIALADGLGSLPKEIKIKIKTP